MREFYTLLFALLIFPIASFSNARAESLTTADLATPKEVNFVDSTNLLPPPSSSSATTTQQMTQPNTQQTTPVQSAPSTNLGSTNSDFETQAREFLHGQLSSLNGRVDVSFENATNVFSNRSCQAPLNFKLNDQVPVTGSVSLSAHCADSKSWTVYLKARIKLFQTVAVASEHLATGNTINENQVSLQEVDVSQLRQGFIQDPSLVLGKQVKRALSAGQVITQFDLKSPVMVYRQDLVNVVAKAGNLMVGVSGEALDDGALGQLVRVKNSQSSRIFQAMVTGPQQVEVRLPG